MRLYIRVKVVIEDEEYEGPEQEVGSTIKKVIKECLDWGDTSVYVYVEGEHGVIPRTLVLPHQQASEI